MSNQPNGHGQSANGYHQNGEQNGYPNNPSSSMAAPTEKVAPATPTGAEKLNHVGTVRPEAKSTVDLDDYFVCPLDKDW